MERLREIFGHGWFELFKPFLVSESFKNIAKALKAEVRKGNIITPDFKDIFKAFKLCTRTNVHTIIVGSEPYPGVTKDGELVADGLAFSSKSMDTCPRSLEFLYDAIDKDIYSGADLTMTDHFDLTRWAQQGILLLNANLTTVAGRTGAHDEIWEEFTRYVMCKISEDRENLAVILLGKKAQDLRSLIQNKTFQVYECEHPQEAIARGGKWIHGHVFGLVNGYQEFNNNIKIKW